MDRLTVVGERFRKFANRVSEMVGSYWAFGLALAGIAGWAAIGPLFHFSDSWQLVINTTTTIITFLVVFLIQTTQNRDARTIHLKLDELIRAQHRARNLFADLEDATEDELRQLQAEFRKLRMRTAERRRREGQRRHPPEQ